MFIGFVAVRITVENCVVLRIIGLRVVLESMLKCVVSKIECDIIGT